MQCRNCHRLNDVGKQVGPDLADIGARLKKDKILESILHPSRTIDPKFSSYIVETVDGRIMTGLLKSKTNEQVVLITTDAKEVSIASNQIDLLVRQPKSLMPDLQLKDMTIQQAADLLAFLMSQKKK
jgi:putative heme-binding domain-containing protein